ncbi:thrombopoietin isoform X1 [Carettochelys insculpta]|uniref:thrombopoietin isoform X1 n=1 Tax=Carettochelys insculpta TaxID=44489 RepID=UPI003EC042DC
MQFRDGQLSMELNRLLLLAAFLLHIKLSRMSPARLVCDNRLIQKYISEAKGLEKRVSQCQELLLLTQPLPLPRVDFSLREWKMKTNEMKRQEILCDLALLVDAVMAAQGQVRQECAAALLGQLYQKANSFLLLLQTFSWQVRPPSAIPCTAPSPPPSALPPSPTQQGERLPLLRSKPGVPAADLALSGHANQRLRAPVLCLGTGPRLRLPD